MFKKSLFILCVASLILGSCSVKKPVVTQKKRTTNTKKVVINKEPEKKETLPKTIIKTVSKNASHEEVVQTYIDNYDEISKEEMLQYGIPASITLAQGILESGAGRGDLVIRANNHFGIKCHDWTGDRVYHDDDEKQECFRKYNDPKYSFRDHSLFLTKRSRYQDLFKLKKDDYKGWAKGLRKAGYATDPKYPDKLINIIERYKLDRYDDEVLDGNPQSTNNSTSSTTSSKKIKTHTVSKGDTLYNIARRYNITVDTLKKYNGLKDNNISIGQVLYVNKVKK